MPDIMGHYLEEKNIRPNRKLKNKKKHDTLEEMEKRIRDRAAGKLVKKAKKTLANRHCNKGKYVKSKLKNINRKRSSPESDIDEALSAKNCRNRQSYMWVNL